MCTIKETLRKKSDQIGITGSFICLVHCMLTSGLIIGSSLMQHGHEHHHHHTLDFWGFVDLSMILVSGVAVYFTTKKCQHHLHAKVMWIVYLLYVITCILKYFGFEPMWLSILSYTASIALISLHLKNLFHTKKVEIV
ncbi:MerC domain-containing protein [Flammeovirga agarivorans]|uniref:MerC domain-containing protein n=1 Tax=Flammeovirga agarivorans TaxID=2726742 RepID=A0A7X8SGF2_9BACT|nr:MerC domain-containing protein [Flammeovirga agarivorans]NLR89755.1 MerC domain-containing protein [Flammeovirga agarivorans]